MAAVKSRSFTRLGQCFVFLAAASAACASAPAPQPATRAAEGPLVGHVERATIEQLPPWREAAANTDVDDNAARALAQVPPGAHVRVFLGTWCGDSRREVTRFWKALDATSGPPPFTVEYIAVDRDMRDPDNFAIAADLRYVPTFIVERGAKEVGRIIESPQASIEQDLGSLLRGERTGVITGRPE